MEAMLEEQVVISLKMNELEAIWLLDFVKTPHSDETDLDEKMRVAIGHSLSPPITESQTRQRQIHG